MSKKVSKSQKNIINNIINDEEKEKIIEEEEKQNKEETGKEKGKDKEEMKERKDEKTNLINENVENENNQEEKPEKEIIEEKKQKKEKDNKNNKKKKKIRNEKKYKNEGEEEIEEEEEDIKEDKKEEKVKPRKRKQKNVKKEKENKNEEKEEEIEGEKEKINRKRIKKSLKLHENANFENDIMDAYKKLAKIDEKEEEQEHGDITEPKNNLNLKYCEKKLWSALKICEDDPDLIINRNIIDKLSRLSLHNKMNLNYIIGEIYISLMNKDALFNYEDTDFEINDLLIFVNKVIQFKDIMKETKIGITYSNSLKKFLLLIIQQFDLHQDQLDGIQFVLDENKEIEHNTLITSNYDDFIDSLLNELENQPNIYEQYQVVIQNEQKIMDMINTSDLKDRDSFDDYLRLGKYLAYLFYNKSYALFINKNISKNDENIQGINFLFYDGYENKGELDIINSQIFYIPEDQRNIELKEKLCGVIIKYVEKYIELIDIFSIQYIIYILIKRVYFYHLNKYKKKVFPLLADSLINMCFFKESPLKLISHFINTILKSKNEEILELKNMVIENINYAKEEKKFFYKIPKNIKLKKEEQNDEDIKKEEKDEEEEEEKEESDDDDENDSNENNFDKGLNEANEEILILNHNDLRIGFLNNKTIYAGEKLVFYEEISHDYSIFDFSLILSEYDVKLTITDLTEDREIFARERLDSILESPLKLIMFFTSPRILKIEIDNTYSWLKSKTIKYKTNVFYPKYPYVMGHQILNSKYKESILQCKKKILDKQKNPKKKKKNKNDADKLLIIKIGGVNKVFNCINVKQNLDAINKMIKDKYLFAASLYVKIKKNIKKVEKIQKIENNEQNGKNENMSYFYYHKKNEGLIEEELKKELLEEYLKHKLLKSNAYFNLINIYIINGDSPKFYNYNYNSVKKLFGFEPEIKIDGSIPKIIFVIQYLNQAQLLYQLYTQISNQEYKDIVLLINYTKYGGYQIILFNNEEIISNLNDFNGLSKNSTIDENVNIIFNGIKKLKDDERYIDIVLTSSIDDKEEEITPEKLEEKLMEKISENDKKYIRIIKTDLKFNKELEINSHVFYLDN